MGIYGLATFLATHRDTAGRRTDLAAVAASQAAAGVAPVVLIDGLAFALHVQEQLLELDGMGGGGGGGGGDGGAEGEGAPAAEAVPGRLATRRLRDASLAGGEYALLDARVAQVVAAFRTAGLHLRCVFDGARGTNWAEFRRKWDTIEERRRQQRGDLHGLQRYCLGEQTDRPVDPGMMLGVLQVQDSLRRNRIDVAVAAGEADDELLAAALADPSVYGVLSADSDFAVVQGVRLIHLHGLDWWSAPGHLWADVFTAETVAGALRLPPERLKELACLCGNDITSGWIDRLEVPMRLGMSAYRIGEHCRISPDDAASWLRALPMPVLEHPIMQGLLSQHPAFAQAIAQSLAFYLGKPAPSNPTEAELRAAGAIRDDDLGAYEPSILRERFHAGTVPVDSLALARNGLAMLNLRLGVPQLAEGGLLDLAHRPLRHVRQRDSVWVGGRQGARAG